MKNKKIEKKLYNLQLVNYKQSMKVQTLLYSRDVNWLELRQFPEAIFYAQPELIFLTRTESRLEPSPFFNPNLGYILV